MLYYDDKFRVRASRSPSKCWTFFCGSAGEYLVFERYPACCLCECKSKVSEENMERGDESRTGLGAITCLPL